VSGEEEVRHEEKAIMQAVIWVYKAGDVDEGKKLFLDEMARWFESNQDEIVARAAVIEEPK
jgi:hypothetical protein